MKLSWYYWCPLLCKSFFTWIFMPVNFLNFICEWLIGLKFIWIDVDECINSLCKHEGTCSNNEGSYFCNCTDGWQGQNCEKGKDAKKKISNLFSKELYIVKTFILVQLTWPLNILIYLDVNECESSPCANNGTCINNLGSYTCDCTEGWKNPDCKTGK